MNIILLERYSSNFMLGKITTDVKYWATYTIKTKINCFYFNNCITREKGCGTYVNIC